MKQIITLILCLLACSLSFAQKNGRDVLDQIENIPLREKERVSQRESKVVEFGALSHVGYGFNIVQSTDFQPWRGNSGDFFLNIVKLGIFPAQWLGVEFGLDFQTRAVRSKMSAFSIDADRHIKVQEFSTLGGPFDESTSSLSTVGLSAPVLVKGRIGYFELGAGVEFQWNGTGRTSYTYRTGSTSTTVSTGKGLVNSWTWNVMATMSFSRLGIFAKYYPATPQNRLVDSPAFSYWTIGMAFGL